MNKYKDLKEYTVSRDVCNKFLKHRFAEGAFINNELPLPQNQRQIAQSAYIYGAIFATFESINKTLLETEGYTVLNHRKLGELEAKINNLEERLDNIENKSSTKREKPEVDSVEIERLFSYIGDKIESLDKFNVELGRNINKNLANHIRELTDKINDIQLIAATGESKPILDNKVQIYKDV
ncbi:hypothetical protein PanWU01x14_221430 [Parasponia andersonii]|uniref:Uncharacterized protein n=1 Tax=Parasponia andersonii TaxID=3476 RepID=A0A2P5BPN5_PARAD|nr:hypothetical protein PanWU01x14_221430 [Parasponia andersonii]